MNAGNKLSLNDAVENVFNTINSILNSEEKKLEQFIKQKKEKRYYLIILFEIFLITLMGIFLFFIQAYLNYLVLTFLLIIILYLQIKKYTHYNYNHTLYLRSKSNFKYYQRRLNLLLNNTKIIENYKGEIEQLNLKINYFNSGFKNYYISIIIKVILPLGSLISYIQVSDYLFDYDLISIIWLIAVFSLLICSLLINVLKKNNLNWNALDDKIKKLKKELYKNPN